MTVNSLPGRVRAQIPPAPGEEVLDRGKVLQIRVKVPQQSHTDVAPSLDLLHDGGGDGVGGECLTPVMVSPGDAVDVVDGDRTVEPVRRKLSRHTFAISKTNNSMTASVHCWVRFG